MPWRGLESIASLRAGLSAFPGSSGAPVKDGAAGAVRKVVSVLLTLVVFRLDSSWEIEGNRNEVLFLGFSLGQESLPLTPLEEHAGSVVSHVSIPCCNRKQTRRPDTRPCSKGFLCIGSSS